MSHASLGGFPGGGLGFRALFRVWIFGLSLGFVGLGLCLGFGFSGLGFRGLGLSLGLRLH